MPTKTPALLTPEARAALLQIPPDLSDRDLARYYTLTPADQAVIARHRLPYNRLGFAVQLCMLRFPGRPLTDLLPLPPRVLHYIAAQVAVDPAAFAAYGARENTLYRHLDEIRRTFGYNACRPRMSKRVTRGKVPRFVVELLGNYWCKKCRLACGNRHVTEFSRSTACGSGLPISILRCVGVEKYRNSGFSALFTAPSTLATRTFATTHAINNYRYSYFAPGDTFAHSGHNTSADASGMPMYPLIPRFTEVARDGSGTINHAIRITVGRDKVRCTDGNEPCDRHVTQTPTVTAGFPQGYIWPASHSDGAVPTTTPAALPMGSHLRLLSTYALECPIKACPEAQVFVTALKQYGAIIADTDGAGYKDMGLHAEWTPDDGTGWDKDDIQQLNNIPIKAFEVVDVTRGNCLDTYGWCPTCANLCSP